MSQGCLAPLNALHVGRANECMKALVPGPGADGQLGKPMLGNKSLIVRDHDHRGAEPRGVGLKRFEDHVSELPNPPALGSARIGRSRMAGLWRHIGARGQANALGVVPASRDRDARLSCSGSDMGACISLSGPSRCAAWASAMIVRHLDILAARLSTEIRRFVCRQLAEDRSGRSRVIAGIRRRDLKHSPTHFITVPRRRKGSPRYFRNGVRPLRKATGKFPVRGRTCRLAAAARQWLIGTRFANRRFPDLDFGGPAARRNRDSERPTANMGSTASGRLSRDVAGRVRSWVSQRPRFT